MKNKVFLKFQHLKRGVSSIFLGKESKIFPGLRYPPRVDIQVRIIRIFFSFLIVLSFVLAVILPNMSVVWQKSRGEIFLSIGFLLLVLYLTFWPIRRP